MHGFQVLTLCKQLHVDGDRRSGTPQAQSIDNIAVIAGDQHISGDTDHGGIILVDQLHLTVFIPDFFQSTTEVDFFCFFFLSDQPYITQT